MSHATEWAAVVNTTAQKYLKGASDLTIRDRKIFRALQNRGRITYNHSGTEVRHQVKFALPEVEAYSGGVIDFEPSDKYRQLYLDWRGYKVSDMMTEKERLMNRGVPQLINRYGNIMKDMRQSLEDQFGIEVYNDGYASGQTDRLCGLDSFTGAGTTATGDKIAEPSDTYGGKSTALANEAGTWSTDLTTSPNSEVGTDWPSGKGDSEYDYLSPRLMNWGSSAWTSNAGSWINNAERCIRQCILWTRLTTGRYGAADMCLLSEDLYYDYLNANEAKFRIQVAHNPADDLGFVGDSVRQDGVVITTEFGIDPQTGFMLNFDKMELRCMDSQLFVPRGPERDINTDSYKFLMGFFGNLVFQPKFFGKLYPYAS